MRTYLVWGLAATIGGTLLYRKMTRSGRAKQWEQHVSESEEHYRSASTRILILGSGFGGLATALQLDQQLSPSDDVSVLVVDRNNDLLFTPLLWTVASGRANPNNVTVPIRNFQKGRRFHVLHAEIERIDLDQKMVHTSTGSRPYDILVIALGSHTIVTDLLGLHEHALPFHSPADALQLRNHLIDAVEAAHHTDDLKERQSWLTFVVGGAGDTGIELAATIHEYLTAGLLNEYPWLVDAPIRVILVGRAERILPMGDPSTAQLVQRVLTKEGIEVLTGTSITGVTETTVETSVGSIPARTLFWAAGITAPDVVSQLPVKHARNGAIIVDNFLRIPGYPNVYVIGDVAWAYDPASGSPVPPTAQAAHRQGIYVGKTIAKQHAESVAQPYRYVMLGHLALLGRHTAVAKVGPITFTGLTAWVFWHVAYLSLNPSWNKRIRLVVDWLLSAQLGRETGQLRLSTGLPQPKKVLEKA
jgi:NADH:ubiquinone reductase (H+-translocating)